MVPERHYRCGCFEVGVVVNSGESAGWPWGRPMNGSARTATGNWRKPNTPISDTTDWPQDAIVPVSALISLDLPQTCGAAVTT